LSQEIIFVDDSVRKPVRFEVKPMHAHPTKAASNSYLAPVPLSGLHTSFGAARAEIYNKVAGNY
jgi:hypothetical protein